MNNAPDHRRSPDLIPGIAAGGVAAGLGPLVAVVFLGFLSVGAPLPTLSLHVHGTLGFGTVVVGCVIGLQSIATVLTRHRAGTVCDQHGPRRSVLLGLPLAAASGALYLASTALPLPPAGQLAVLLLGRICMGLGESLFLTGTMTWGIARLGPARTGKVMSWQGMAMYAALGLGAPLGLAAQERFGFTAVAMVTLVAPLLAMGIALALPATPAAGGSRRVAFHHVIGRIWQPGLVLALATVPFAAMASFLSLDYAAHGWQGGWHGAGPALTLFTVGYVAVRLLGLHLPDRYGATGVAAASLLIEVLGQLLVWLAPGPGLAAAGALLTGIGFSLVFPTMGVEATRRVPAEQRGRAVGNFTAFFDIAIGLTGPVVGLIAGPFGLPAAFLVGALATAASCALVLSFRSGPRP